ncbi:MAG: sigma-70 family RNA polymerase sigma factor [Clostridia bacterium]|nr:sigma-70 family RNA polymerase sigma factor [Clostridia bacterium]
MLKEKNRTAADGSDPPAAAAESQALLLLIERAKEGDSDAYSALVEEFERFVYNTALRVLSASGMPPDSAEDIAQDAFIKAWRNLPSFRGDCSFSTWLFRITVNCARDAVRSAVRHATVSLTRNDDEDEDGSEWDVPVTSGDDIPEDAMLRREQILAVRRAIEALPEDQRQVIVMRDIHELSYQTIADTLGIGIGTVKSRINRGRAGLKALLESGKYL